VSVKEQTLLEMIIIYWHLIYTNVFVDVYALLII